MYEKYYLDKNIQFNTYAYSIPGCEQGDYVYGQKDDMGMATVENFLTYKEVGFNMVESGTVLYHERAYKRKRFKRLERYAVR